MCGTDQYQMLDTIEITLRGPDGTVPIYINIFDNSLSRKWLNSLNHLLSNQYVLEKNFCFLGFANSPRNGEYIVSQINKSIEAINQANIGYTIADHFTLENSILPGELVLVEYQDEKQRPVNIPGDINREHFNQLHRYFEDLQGVSGKMSEYYNRSSPTVKWHIRQLNLLCHEFESWVLSNKKKSTAPKWMRPSQLMCWLNAPRFVLDDEDHSLFGIETMNRSLGGVYVGVNKAVGKHHWEVFVDEAAYDPNVIIDNLTTTVLSSQIEAAGDFDIEWANNPGDYPWQKKHLADFRQWLINNNFDPDDKSLTIGHPQIGQVDLMRSFGTDDYEIIWKMLDAYLDVYKIQTKNSVAVYEYHWNDPDFIDRQIKEIY